MIFARRDGIHPFDLDAACEHWLSVPLEVDICHAGQERAVVWLEGIRNKNAVVVVHPLVGRINPGPGDWGLDAIGALTEEGISEPQGLTDKLCHGADRFQRHLRKDHGATRLQIGGEGRFGSFKGFRRTGIDNHDLSGSEGFARLCGAGVRAEVLEPFQEVVVPNNNERVSAFGGLVFRQIINHAIEKESGSGLTQAIEFQGALEHHSAAEEYLLQGRAEPVLVSKKDAARISSRWQIKA